MKEGAAGKPAKALFPYLMAVLISEYSAV